MRGCTNSTELDRLAGELRTALRSRDLTRGRELVLAYRSEFDHQWLEMTASERKQSRMLEEALELLQWARTMALSSRQEIDWQRKCLRGSRKYLAPAGPETDSGMSA